MNNREVIHKTDLIQDELYTMRKDWKTSEYCEQLIESAQLIVNQIKHEAAKRALNDDQMDQRRLERMREAGGV